MGLTFIAKQAVLHSINRLTQSQLRQEIDPNQKSRGLSLNSQWACIATMGSRWSRMKWERSILCFLRQDYLLIAGISPSFRRPQLMVILIEWQLSDLSHLVLPHKAPEVIASQLWCTQYKHLQTSKALVISWASIRIIPAFRLVITIANKAHIKIVFKYTPGSKHSQSAKVIFMTRLRKDQWQD